MPKFAENLQKWLLSAPEWSARMREDRRLPDEKKVRRLENAHINSQIERSYTRFENTSYRILEIAFCVLFIGVLLFTVVNLPRYGGADVPAVNEVTERYLEKGMEETGAVNAVAGMILDYRAFDTLGESFVLFTAVCAVIILMRNTTPLDLKQEDPDTYHYHFYHDEIIRTLCRVIIPVVYLLGFYIILNGHLSPGGGFSGGAVLGAGCILYAVVYGERKARAIFTEGRIKAVTLCSLLFYALAKSYSFFTGANHLPSIISPGVPGRIFSAGLILPLNVAVGLVVCCTMYSMYMFFRRGDY